MGLTLITGPANAGKVALLLRRYLEALDDEPYLIVPNRSDVDRVERDLLELQPALFAGSIGTFDDLFSRIARRGGNTRQVATDAKSNEITAIPRLRELLYLQHTVFPFDAAGCQK